MTKLAAWLIALVGPLVAKAVIALGFTALTFTGVQAVVDQLIGLAQTHWGSIPAAALNLASLSGIPECLGMIFGAYSSVFAAWVSVGASRYVLKKS